MNPFTPNRALPGAHERRAGGLFVASARVALPSFVLCVLWSLSAVIAWVLGQDQQLRFFALLAVGAGGAFSSAWMLHRWAACRLDERMLQRRPARFLCLDEEIH